MLVVVILLLFAEATKKALLENSNTCYTCMSLPLLYYVMCKGRVKTYLDVFVTFTHPTVHSSADFHIFNVCENQMISKSKR